MTVHIGNLLDNKVITFPKAGCHSCAQTCRQSKSINIELPASELRKLKDSQRVELVMNSSLQMKLMLNSILLPLFGFVTGALVSDSLQLNDFGAVTCSLIGLALGILACRRFSYSHLQISDPSVSVRPTISVSQK
ncbi:MAG: SoxR reducing system RseC family protein [Pseudomonadales bacterium]